jgi:hypothetical protein
MKYDINCIYVLKAYLNKILLIKHKDVRTALGFETKSMISLGNPASDFLHCIRLFMNIEKM